jgi:transposase InsO family protein
MEKAEPHVEPLKPSEFPEGPWMKVGSDLMELDKSVYLVVVDYYSRFIELAKLENTTTSSVLNHLKSMFSRHGYPQTLVSDNGPQYSSKEFKLYALEHGITHITSSPGHPSGNGAAERAVRTVKDILKASKDPYNAMLAYRTTPLENGYSPAELLMSRKLRTKLPSITSKPETVNFAKVKEKEEQIKLNRAFTHDQRHLAKTLPPLQEGGKVWLKDRQQEGEVQGKHHDRSYFVQTDSGVYRRNRSQLQRLPETNTSDLETVETIETMPTTSIEEAGKKTRYGRNIKTPNRLIEQC